MSCKACATCKFWEAGEPNYAKGYYGVCSMPADEYRVDEKTYMFIDDGPYGEGGGNVWTRGDFSCIAYEAKE